MRVRACEMRLSSPRRRLVALLLLSVTLGCNGGSITIPTVPTVVPPTPHPVPPTPPGTFDISGSYDLVFAASNACTDLPNEVKTRTYLAAVDQSPDKSALGNVRVVLSGAQFGSTQDYCAPGNRFFGTIDGTSVHFALVTDAVAPCEDWGGFPAVIERIGPVAQFSIIGRGKGTVDDSAILGVVEGVFQFDAGPRSHWACSASDHGFTMRRR